MQSRSTANGFPDEVDNSTSSAAGHSPENTRDARPQANGRVVNGTASDHSTEKNDLERTASNSTSMSAGAIPGETREERIAR
mgnify:FL=1